MNARARYRAAAQLLRNTGIYGSQRAGRSGDRIPVGGGARFSAPAQTVHGAHPASYTMGTGSFPGVKRPGRRVDYLPPSSSEVKERVELYLYSSGPSWPVIGDLYICDNYFIGIYLYICYLFGNIIVNQMTNVCICLIFYKSVTYFVGRLAQSVYRLATGWTVRGSNSGGGEIFRTCPGRPWGPPRLLYHGYRVFPGGRMRPGRDADPSPTSSAEV
jgi:hypothetical protein